MYTSKKIDNSNAIKLKFLNIMLAPPPKKSILEAIDLLHGHLVVINYILNRIPFFIWTLGMLEGVQGRVFYYKTMACG